MQESSREIGGSGALARLSRHRLDFSLRGSGPMHPTRRNRRKPKQPSRERAGVPVVLRLVPTYGLSVRLSSGTRQFLSTNPDEGYAHCSEPEHRSKRPYNTFPSSSRHTSRRSTLPASSDMVAPTRLVYQGRPNTAIRFLAANFR